MFENTHPRFPYEEKKLTINGLEDKSSDHYYQLHKFLGQPCFDLSKRLMNQSDIHLIGRNFDLCPNWNDVCSINL